MLDRAKTLALLGLTLAGAAQAQNPDPAELRQNIELLRGVLEDALDLNRASGFFGISVGGVEGTYLHGQGVVLELRSPLANRRNRLELTALNSTMQSLSARANPFTAINDNSAARADGSIGVTTDTADSFYQQMMERMADIDYSLMVSNAVQQAGDAARSLRSMGELNEEDYARLRTELDELRQRMQDSLGELRTFEQSLREDPEASTTPDRKQSLSDRLDGLLARLEPLREDAVSLARELQARNEAAAERHKARWQQDLADLESTLYQALCDFGASLRALPDNQYVSIILTGLGEESVDNLPRDKVHVLASSDLQQCQNGALTPAALLERAIRYSY